MSMAMMVAMAGRKRDDRGRYADGNDDRRMGNDHSTYMGDMPEMRRRRDDRGRYMDGDDGARMGYDEPEMRRRRDSRGRYMEGDDGASMAYDGGTYAHYPWREPHMPPYLDGGRMEGEHGRERRGMNDRMMHDGARPMRDRNTINIRDYQDRRRIGYGANDDEDEEAFNRERAEAWVARMHGDDPNHPVGAKWTPEQVKPYAQKYGFPAEGDEFWEFYAIINAMYADNYETAKEYGLVKPEFFASLARNWLRDKDAVPDKVDAYLKHVVKK